MRPASARAGSSQRGPDRPAPRGMTLVELLVVLLVLLLVAAGISRLLASAWDSQQAISGQNECQKRAQRAVDTVVDSLRGASGVQSGDGARITATLPSGNTMSYYLHLQELRRDRYDNASGQTTVGEIICDHVSNLSFGYYHRAGNLWVLAASPTLGQSVLVSVTVALEQDHATETSLVRFRNQV